MYRGSMVGAGFGPYAVMGYVIANQQPGSDKVFRVDLNPVLLATTFGESEAKIEEAIEFLCAPDAKSTTPVEEGRRLVREGSFSYRVVNGAHYAAIRNEEDRREQNRLAQERHRQKKKQVKRVKPGQPLPGERAALEHGVTIHEHREPGDAGQDNGEPPVDEAPVSKLSDPPEE